MSLKEQFDAAVIASKSLPEQPDNMTLLQLYGLFKQATEGDVLGTRPGFSEMVARAKWDAWSELKALSQDNAMRQYVGLVDELKDE